MPPVPARSLPPNLFNLEFPSLNREAGRDRSRTGEIEYSAMREQCFGRIEFFHLKLEDLQTSVVGNIGLAWGVFTEDFQEKGRPPEFARGRFSSTLSKGARGW